MKRIVIILLVFFLSITSGFSQKNSDTTKLKRWEFSFHTGISINSKPNDINKYNPTRKPGVYLYPCVSFSPLKWLIINSGIGFYNSSFNYSVPYRQDIFDSIGNPVSVDTGHSIIKARNFKFFLPLNVYFRIMNLNNKHVIKIGLGFHKEFAISGSFTSNLYLHNEKISRTGSFNNEFSSFFKISKGDFLSRLMVEYNYRFKKNYTMGIGYIVFTNFQSRWIYNSTGGTYQSIYLIISI